MLKPGRSIWFINKVDNIIHSVGPVVVLTLRKILPAGKIEGSDVVRDRSLVQVYTDPGGIRTLAAADVWSKDPGKADRPW